MRHAYGDIAEGGSGRMGPVILELAPLALAVAASPFGVVPAVLLLFTDRPRLTSGGFVAGWFAGILAVTVAATALAGTLEFDEKPTWVFVVKLALGAVLLLLAARQWSARHAGEEPGWLAAVGRATPAGAARLALLLSSANPKVVLLAAAAGVAVGRSDLTTAGRVSAVLGFAGLASVTVLLPWLAHLLAGERALAPLGRLRDWLVRHNGVIVTVVLGTIAVVLVAEGLAGL